MRLGKIAKRAAETVKVRVEHLLNAKITNQPVDGDTARGVASLDEVLLDRLARVGLAEKREAAGLEAFIDHYISQRFETSHHHQDESNTWFPLGVLRDS